MGQTQMDKPDKSSSPHQSLSEISHLFLTGLREKQSGRQSLRAGGAAIPHRTPPRKGEPAPRKMVSVDVTPQEMAGEHVSDRRPSLSVVLAHHLAGAAVQRVREYARHAAAVSGRVGLIELGDDGLRLTSFDASPLGKLDSDSAANPAACVEPVNGKRISEALEELNWDIQRWILFLPGGTKSDKAKQLLERIEHWTVLTSADDQGIIAAYRSLKGLPEIGKASLSMAVFGAEDEAHGTLVHRKLAGACRQFLGRQLDCEGRVTASSNATEHVVLMCRAAGGADAPQEHWTAVMELAEQSAEPISAQPGAPAAEEIEQSPVVEEAQAQEPIPMKMAPMEKIESKSDALDDVVELAAGGDDADAILNAVVQRQSQWVVCPVSAPNCTATTVAVDREGHLILAAVAGGGLAKLPAISRAYAWLIENRPLVRMALPQMNIEAKAMPKLVLVVDQIDAAGDQLATILQGGNVTVQTYRRLRWGEKTGLLLEAA